MVLSPIQTLITCRDSPGSSERGAKIVAWLGGMLSGTQRSGTQSQYRSWSRRTGLAHLFCGLLSRTDCGSDGHHRRRVVSQRLSISDAQPRRSATPASFLLILHRRSCCPGSTSSTWGSPSNERDVSRSPITCPMAHRLLATGCAQPWSRKRDRTGARGQVRLFPMDWNAWKKPGRQAISSSWRVNPIAGRSGFTTFPPLVCQA